MGQAIQQISTKSAKPILDKKEGHLVGNDNNFEIIVFAIVTYIENCGD